MHQEFSPQLLRELPHEREREQDAQQPVESRCSRRHSRHRFRRARPWATNRGPGEPAQAQAIAERAKVALAQELNGLGPNSEYVDVERRYRRYGPAADQIPASEGPETITTTLTVTFDARGNQSTLLSETRANDGTLLQTARSVDGAYEHVNVVTGETRRLVPTDGLISAERFKSETLAANVKRAGLVDGDAHWEVVARSQGTIQVRGPAVLPHIPESADGYTIPYVRDLAPVDSYTLVTLDAVTYSPLKHETYVVGADGRTTLVELIEKVSTTVSQTTPTQP